MAALMGDLDIVKALLSKTASIDAKNEVEPLQIVSLAVGFFVTGRQLNRWGLMQLLCYSLGMCFNLVGGAFVYAIMLSLKGDKLVFL